MEKLLTTNVIVCISLLLSFSGCKGNSDATAPHKPRVALVMKSLANDFFREMEEGARKHQSEHSVQYELTTNGIKDEQDVGKQIDLVSQMVAMGIDALVLAPADSKALVSAVKRAQNAGVVVINIDNRLDPGVLTSKGMRVPYVGPSNRKGAAMAAGVVTEHLHAGDEVAIIEGLPTAANGRERIAGFVQSITAASLKVVSSQAGNWDMGKANQLAAAVLNEHPNIKAFFCANDTMALGAVSALRSAGKLGQVKVVGFDNIAAVAQLVKSGEVAATVDQHGGQLAVFGIEYALAIVNKQAIPDDKETPVTLVER